MFINSKFALLVCIFCLLLPFCPVFEGFFGFIVYIIDSVFGYACFIILLTVWIFSALSLNFQDIFLSWSLLFNIYSWSPLTSALSRSSGSRSQDYFCRARTWRTTEGNSGIFSMSETVCMQRMGLWAQRHQLKLRLEHWPVVLTPTVPDSPSVNRENTSYLAGLQPGWKGSPGPLDLHIYCEWVFIN